MNAAILFVSHGEQMNLFVIALRDQKGEDYCQI